MDATISRALLRNSKAASVTALAGILIAMLALPPAALAAAREEKPLQPGVAEVPYDDSVFSPDPDYAEKPYDPQAQKDIYGAKHLNRNQRPLIELFRNLYDWGAFREPKTWLGEANPMAPQFMIFGDARMAVAYNEDPTRGGLKQGRVAATFNFDLDLRITDTERFHALMQPLQDGNQFTRFEFAGDDTKDFEGEFDPNPTTLFFEGDLGAMIMGFTGKDNRYDMPFAGGYLMPMLMQNGVWMEDAFSGFAFAIPARNSRRLDISNMDVTFFAGFDQVNTAATGGDDNGARIYGVATFIEALDGYWEAGYGYTEDRTSLDRDYHNLTLAYTRRWSNIASLGGRVIANVGQDTGGPRTADGVLLLFESSLITSKPSNVVPYFNAYFGYKRAVPLARAAGALRNTGILFETDLLTNFPFLNDTGFDSTGGALGINWLGAAFNWQLVTEIAGVYDWDDVDGVEQNSVAGAVRVQVPITNAFLLRADAMYSVQLDAPDLLGGRFELRYKF